MEAETRMRESLRKLALWHTRTFKPITTHDELELIMTTLGFIPLPPSSSSSSAAAAGWKEYAYAASARRERDLQQPPPRPRLPYPRIDGLHTYTYQAFIDAVNFHLQMPDISDLFHVRGMPLQKVDLYKKWRKMQEDDTESVFVYREGTLDQSTYYHYHFDKQQINNNFNSDHSTAFLHRSIKSGTASSPGCFVPLKDIIV